MTPAGLKSNVIKLFGDTRQPMPMAELRDIASSFTEGESKPPCIPIVTPRNAGMRLAALLARPGLVATTYVSSPMSGRAVTECVFNNDRSLDRLVGYARPTIELLGRDGARLQCGLVHVAVDGSCLEITFEPSQAYELNWKEGPEHVWLAAVTTVVIIDDKAIYLGNQRCDASQPLRRT